MDYMIMRANSVEILPLAREDIVDIFNYMALDNPDAALNLTNNIIDKIETLSISPERCPLVPDGKLAKQEYRMLIIGNYIAFFKIFTANVLVYRVLHGKRYYSQLLK